MTTNERYKEFLRRACDIAKELRLEVEFTTMTHGHGYISYQAPGVIITTTDTNEYMEADGRTTIA